MIDCTADGHFTIAPSLRDMIVSSPGELAGEARMVAAVKGGSPAGVKVYAIEPSSLWASLGYESGDRIHTVGGAEITTVDGARDALEQLRDATEIVVELERRGRDVALRYQVR
jgi:type II secretory pathway component PulC